ncbi:MAG: hypothetical protein HYX84_02140 [Chloroflexi bacterium]|nr:hypothetical protein [Chloroflexota bacterium]
MASLQYLIDSICANFSVKALHDLVKAQLNRGPCLVSEIAREIRCDDRTLDFASSKELAEAVLEVLEESGEVTREGDWVHRAT